MRTAAAPDERPASDLTAKARIRDAAIACFAEQGFDASFRTIAARAGVSPGLITHHFGSKEALRAECDTEVLRQYTAYENDALDMPADEMFTLLADPGFSANLLVYMLRAIHAGGQPARDFLDRLVDDVRVIMARSRDAGLLKPSRDEEARLRYLTYLTMGAMLVQFVTSPEQTPDEFVASIHERQQDQILPTLELFTEGVFAQRTMLDDYVRYLWRPPDAATGPESQTA